MRKLAVGLLGSLLQLVGTNGQRIARRSKKPSWSGMPKSRGRKRKPPAKAPPVSARMPADICEDYKPFRNYLRRFDLVSSLVDVWRYSVHIMDNQPLPADYAIGRMTATTKAIKEHIYPWDLDVLTKEIVLNAGKSGDRSLRVWNHLATAINHIRRLDEACSKLGRPEDILLELHRLAHRQFPWQTPMRMNPMVRVLKVFGAEAVARIVERELGMSTLQFLQLGMALSGNFQRRPNMSTTQDYAAVLGIARDASDAFLRRITCTMEHLKAEVSKQQSYSRDWLYTWNPLEATPLVSFDPEHPDRVICPIPRYLFRRASIGIFYDLVKATDFDNPYGNAFQAYVGAIMRATCAPPSFTILPEEPYYVGTNKMHGVDWVLSDSTGHLFIESKTKRLTIGAKTLLDAAALDKDLTVMATAIAQHYQNIRRAQNGLTKWVSDQLPIYPLVLTLEDWFIFSPPIQEQLDKHVRRLLAAADIQEQMIEEMPYTIASAHEFEIASQIVAKLSISGVMAKKTAAEHWRWSLLPFLHNEFAHAMRGVNWRLFAEDWARLMPDPPEKTT